MAEKDPEEEKERREQEQVQISEQRTAAAAACAVFVEAAIGWNPPGGSGWGPGSREATTVEEVQAALLMRAPSLQEVSHSYSVLHSWCMRVDQDGSLMVLC